MPKKSVPLKKAKKGDVHPSSTERTTLEEARKLYPDEWVVFSHARANAENTDFQDGLIYFHCKEQEEAYRRSAEIEGDVACFYTGRIPYRGITLRQDESGKAAA